MITNKPCPICGGSDRFYLIVAPSSGGDPYWRCRQCDYTEPHEGDDDTTEHHQAQQPARTPEQISAAQLAYTVVAERCMANLWTQAGKPALDYLRRRGLTDATIRAARLGWAGYDTSLMADLWHEDGRKWGSARTAYIYESPYDGALFGGLRSHFGATKPVIRGTITIPYLDGDRCVLLRGRKLVTKPGEAKYLSPAGPLYAGGTPRLYLQETMSAGPVILTEGEFKALAAWQAWKEGRSPYPCVATCGVMYLPPAMIEALRGHEVYLGYDAEQPKRGRRESPADMAISRNGAKLRKAGITVRVIELPRAAGVPKVDLDSYLLAA